MDILREELRPCGYYMLVVRAHVGPGVAGIVACKVEDIIY